MRSVEALDVRVDHALSVCVIEDELLGVLSETRDLLGAGLVETLLVELDVQGSAEKYGALVERLGIRLGSFFHLAEIFFEAEAIEATLPSPTTK